MDLTTDIKKLSSGTVTLAFYAAFKLSKASQTKTLNEILEGFKTTFNKLAEGAITPPTAGEMTKAVFKVAYGIGNAGHIVALEELEIIAQEIYDSFTGGNPADFATIFNEIKDLVHGRVDVDPAVNVDADITMIEEGLATILSFGLSKIKDDNAKAIIASVFTDMNLAFSTIDANNPPADTDATNGLFDMLDATGDLSQNKKVISVFSIVKTVFKIIVGPQGAFIKFWQGLVQAGKLSTALKAA